MAKTIMQASGSNSSTANTTEYRRISGEISKDTTRTNKEIRTPANNITFSNMWIKLSANTCTTLTFALMNSSTALNSTIAPGSSATGDFEDTTNTDLVVGIGTLMSLRSIPSATGTFTIMIISFITNSATATAYTVLSTITTQNFTTASTTTFFFLHGDDQAADEASAKCRMRKASQLQRMAVYVSANRATSSTVRIRKNTANGSPVVTITGGAGAGWFVDTTNVETFVAGDDMDYSVTTGTGVDTLTIKTISSDLASTNGDALLMVNHATAIAVTDGTTRNFNIHGNLVQHTNESGASGAAVEARAIFDCNELSVTVTQNDVTSASSLPLRINGADSALIVSITGSTTGIFGDQTHTITTAASDMINYQLVVPTVSGTHTVTIRQISMWIKDNLGAPVDCVVTSKVTRNKNIRVV